MNTTSPVAMTQHDKRAVVLLGNVHADAVRFDEPMREVGHESVLLGAG
jgi:hypothetical protein